ncbi:MAG: FUSC family protein [Candidatus Acidiferrales bacterium]|jgi:uncharacterized membrane protein YgaE (UPF0421/DUF939 family)
MTQSGSAVLSRLSWQGLEHPVRTTVAAVASLLVARLFRLPEAYWAAITTLVVMQSNIEDAMTSSWQRFVGTALGAAAGALLAMYFGPSAIVFGAGVFVLGLVCAVLHLDRPAYRFAGITLAIILLIARASAPWVIAAHRFFEVSVGIAVGLAVTAAWPERKPA